MTDHERCPECDSPQTTIQYQDETYSDEIHQVKTCNDCPTEYVVVYGDPCIEEVTRYDE